jgi:hypothetical protein
MFCVPRYSGSLVTVIRLEANHRCFRVCKIILTKVTYFTSFEDHELSGASIIIPASVMFVLLIVGAREWAVGSIPHCDNIHTKTSKVDQLVQKLKVHTHTT